MKEDTYMIGALAKGPGGLPSKHKGQKSGPGREVRSPRPGKTPPPAKKK
jgi:hypothetical protein